MKDKIALIDTKLDLVLNTWMYQVTLEASHDESMFFIILGLRLLEIREKKLCHGLVSPRGSSNALHLAVLRFESPSRSDSSQRQ